ncbi:hypothetical protein TARUN_3684 [Trichoderma arundinaceum]|uniref:Uncharacterized protein n=1 Tax=Trichoderma arundinaceum TaxID=490622 RepID=A0A395NRH4_TRIAR|nr:hypothetical protein TARUN_3684 [Trichoderma arundinaceum]
MSTRGDRWDRDRLVGERDRVQERGRFVEEDRVFMSGGRGGRDRSDERLDRKYGRTSYEDDIVRDRRYYEDDIRFERRPEPRGEPFDRRVVVEKERDREYYRDSSPRRPTLLRRQSSLDTYDRRPLPRFFDQREELPPPARREDIRREDFYREEHRAPAYTPIPLPKARGLPAPRRYDERFYEDIHVEHDHIDDGIPHYPSERIVEREIIREKEKEKEKEKRSRSRESRSTKKSHRGRSRASKSSSRSSSSSSSSSSSGGTTVKSAKSTKSEYPKKGKTRIPARLGNVIVVQKALGQANIDHLLKLSEEYKSSELEIAAARSSAGEIIRERREELIIEAPAHPPPQILIPAPAPPPPPVIIEAAPRDVELIDKTVYREISPSRSRSSRSRSHSHHHHHSHHVSGEYQLVERHRSRSRSGKDIRAEIRALEKELATGRKREVGERELIRTERLPNGELVVFEEQVERIASHKPARIEKDKKGRMSISVPKYR